VARPPRLFDLDASVIGNGDLGDPSPKLGRPERRHVSGIERTEVREAAPQSSSGRVERPPGLPAPRLIRGEVPQRRRVGTDDPIEESHRPSVIPPARPAWPGRAGRVAALEWLIRQMRAEPNVWWATCGEVAAWQIETDQNLGVTVPIPT